MRSEMVPSQMISPFDHFKQIVKQLCPTVTDLKCDARPGNVEPIKYDDCGEHRTEYPPVISWNIGNTRFKYVLAPKFKPVYNDTRVSIISGSTRRTVVEYKEQEQLVTELIKYTVEGKTSDEINSILKQPGERNEYYYK
jgi:hypothetical protein